MRVCGAGPPVSTRCSHFNHTQGCSALAFSAPTALVQGSCLCPGCSGGDRTDRRRRNPAGPRLPPGADSLLPRAHVGVNGHTVVGSVSELLLTHLGAVGGRELFSTRCRGPSIMTRGSGTPICTLKPSSTLGCHISQKPHSPGWNLGNPPGIVRQEEGAGAGGRLGQRICGLIAGGVEGPEMRKIGGAQGSV